MRKTTIISFMISLITLNLLDSSAQDSWQWQNPLPQGNTLKSVFFIDVNTGWQVGEGGTILYTDDAGVNWSRQSSTTTNDLENVYFVNFNNGWAVGAEGTILHTANGGKTWNEQVYNSPQLFKSVHFINENVGWIVGQGRIGNITYRPVLHTTNGGQTWNWVDAAYGKDLNSVFFVDANNGWIVGPGGTILSTNNGGNTWQAQTSGTDKILASVHFTNENYGWAVGYPKIGQAGIILHTDDGGVTWNEQDSGTTYYRFYSVYFVNDSTGWVGGWSGTILHTTNGGESWTRKIMPNLPTLYGLHFADPNHGWAVGHWGMNYFTENGGETWQERSSGYYERLYGVHFTSQENGCAVGGEIYYTRDGGKTWDQAQTSQLVYHSLRDVYFPDQINGTAVGDDGQIFHTADGGENWTEQSSGTWRDLYGVHFVDSQYGWAVGSYGIILHTSNGGNTWVNQVSGTTNSIYSVFFSDRDTGWALLSRTILHTTNGGNSWSTQYSESTNGLWDIFFLDSEKGWAVGGRAVLNTVNGGDTWNIQTTDVLGNSIYFLDEQHGWTAGREGSIFATTNGGNSWKKQVSGTSQDLKDIFFADTNTGWTVGGYGIILNTIDGGSSNHPPVLISADIVTANEHEYFEYTALASDPDPDDTVIIYSFQEYPIWLTPSQSTISGTPPEGAQDTSFVVIASDGELSDTLQVALNVIPVNDAPKLNSPEMVNAYEDSLFEFIARALDPEDSAITYSYFSYPVWLTPADSVISGTPTHSSADTSFTVTASDGELTDTLSVTVKIIRNNTPPQIINLADFTFINTKTYLIDLDTCVVDQDHSPPEMSWQIIPADTNLKISLDTHIATFSAPDWAGETRIDFIVTDPESASDSVSVNGKISFPVSVGSPGKQIPEFFTLEQNYPNPFNPSTTIHFAIPKSSLVTLKIYNLLGKEIETLINDQRPAGEYKINWAPANLPSGIFLYRLQAGDFNETRKLMLLK